MAVAIINLLNKSSKSHFFGWGIPVLFGIKLSSAHVSVTTVISGAISECLPNEIMQTCSHSNKVGLFAEIQPRLFPAEIVVRVLKPD